MHRSKHALRNSLAAGHQRSHGQNRNVPAVICGVTASDAFGPHWVDLFIYFLIFLNLFERVMGTDVPCRPKFRLGMSGSAASCHSYPHAQLNLSVVNPLPSKRRNVL